MKLADKYRKLGIRTNADQPDQVENAIAFGAEGIGLCRTEHMFFEGDRIIAVRQMILADDLRRPPKGAGQIAAASAGRFRRHLPGTGRPAGVHSLARSAVARIPAAARQPEGAAGSGQAARHFGRARSNKRVHELHEFNPMLGFRGCRLGIKFPEITEMQARAIFQAAAAVLKEGIKVQAGSHDPAGRLQEASWICKSKSSIASPAK